MPARRPEAPITSTEPASATQSRHSAFASMVAPSRAIRSAAPPGSSTAAGSARAAASMRRMAAPRAASGVWGSTPAPGIVCSLVSTIRPLYRIIQRRRSGRRSSGIMAAVPLSTWTPCRAPVRIAPRLLAADFGRIAESVHALVNSGAERLHVDVMDGVFVPNFTFGTDTVRALRKETSLPLELHLMIVEPERHVATFAEAGADGITVHYEASPHMHRTLETIRGLDCRAGAAINPSTPASML